MVTIYDIEPGSEIVDGSGKVLIVIVKVDENRRKMEYRFPGNKSIDGTVCANKEGILFLEWNVKRPITPPIVKIKLGELV